MSEGPETAVFQWLCFIVIGVLPVETTMFRTDT